MKISTEAKCKTAEAVQPEATSFGRPLAEREERQPEPLVRMQQQQHGACPKWVAQQQLSGRK